MSIGQGSGQLLAIGRLEAKPLPERPRPPTEQPSRPRPLTSSLVQREPRQHGPIPATPSIRMHSDAPDQRMITVGAELKPGAPDHRTGVVAIDPDQHTRVLKTAQRQVSFLQKLPQRCPIFRRHDLGSHSLQSFIAGE